jgi:hypothetical protein
MNENAMWPFAPGTNPRDYKTAELDPELMDETIQVVLHPALRYAFERWLDSRGAMMVPIPTGPDELPTYVISPSS